MRAKIMEERQFKDFYSRVECRCFEVSVGYSKYDYCLKEMLIKTIILTSMAACEGKAFTSKQIEELNDLSTKILIKCRKEEEQDERIDNSRGK